MNSINRHRLNVIADPTICHLCEKPALPGVDEFGGHSCAVCRARLEEARRRLALQGERGDAYSQRLPRADVR